MTSPFVKGIEHAVASAAAFLIPIVLLGMGTSWQSITIGAILNGLYVWARAEISQ